MPTFTPNNALILIVVLAVQRGGIFRGIRHRADIDNTP
jgi:hypothetical protein